LPGSDDAPSPDRAAAEIGCAPRQTCLVLTASDPIPRPLPRRIVVAGVSGVGKSTLARRVAGGLGLPYTEIDALYHGPDWTPRPSFRSEIAELAAGDAWVTEWQYPDARPLLADRAELLVWLDLPFRVTLARVIRRTVRRARTHQELWNGNVEPGLWHAVANRDGVVRWAVATRHRFRREVPPLAESHPGLVVVRLRSRREVDGWAAALAG
jgi:adenylate kinase family enzyme